jgi:hypothetical protein
VLRVHLADGKTLAVDLRDERQAREWLANAQAMQPDITAMTLLIDGASYSIPKPRGFRSRDISMMADIGPRGDERLLCHAGETSIRVLAHANRRAVRIDVAREGRQTFNPLFQRSA